jgi:hypothetical protein
MDFTTVEHEACDREARHRPSLRKTLLSGKRSVTRSCVNSHTNAAAQRQSLTRPAIAPPHQHVFDVLPPPAQQFTLPLLRLRDKEKRIAANGLMPHICGVNIAKVSCVGRGLGAK